MSIKIHEHGILNSQRYTAYISVSETVCLFSKGVYVIADSVYLPPSFYVISVVVNARRVSGEARHFALRVYNETGDNIQVLFDLDEVVSIVALSGVLRCYRCLQFLVVNMSNQSAEISIDNVSYFTYPQVNNKKEHVLEELWGDELV